MIKCDAMLARRCGDKSACMTSKLSNMSLLLVIGLPECREGISGKYFASMGSTGGGDVSNFECSCSGCADGGRVSNKYSRSLTERTVII